MASIALNFLLGRTLAERTGVVDEGSKTVVSVVMMGLGLTPVGVLLARQIALQRVPKPAPTGEVPQLGVSSGTTGSGSTAGAEPSFTSSKPKS